MDNAAPVIRRDEKRADERVGRCVAVPVRAYRLAPPSCAAWQVREDPAPEFSPARRTDPPRPASLREAVHRLMRLRRMSPRTEDAYLHWMRRFVAYHGGRSPVDLGAEHVTAFLSDLATRGRVAASTQNQALAALLFLYRDVYGVEVPWPAAH